MTEFGRLHTVLFDELKRQGVLIHGIDLDRLTAAVVAARTLVDRQLLTAGPSNPRCVHGACDE